MSAKVRKTHWKDDSGKIRCGDKRNVWFISDKSDGDFTSITCLKCRYLLRKDLLRSCIAMFKLGKELDKIVKEFKIISEEEII